jgi:hypothetical protein
MAFGDWLSGLFSAGSGAADAAGAASALTSADDSWNLSNTVPASSLAPGDDSWDLSGYGAAGTPAAGGLGQFASGLKNLGGDLSKLMPTQQQPNFGGGPPSGAQNVGRGNPNALAALTNILNQRQAALLQAQQQGAPPPQNRTIGLLGF